MRTELNTVEEDLESISLHGSGPEIAKSYARLDSLIETLGDIQEEVATLEPLVSDMERNGSRALTPEDNTIIDGIIEKSNSIKPLLALLAEDFDLSTTLSLESKFKEIFARTESQDETQPASARLQETIYKIGNVQSIVTVLMETNEDSEALDKRVAEL